MKKITSGTYKIKYRGRGPLVCFLTLTRVKALYELENVLEIEYIEKIKNA